MKKICAIGHYGLGKTLLNGQTIKTKIFTNQLAHVYGGHEIQRVDTHGGVRAILSVIFDLFSGMKECLNIIIFPSDNGLKIIVPLIAIFNLLFKRELHYIVIGGYLQDYLKEHKWITLLLKRYKGIYVETEPMKQALELSGFNNVFVVPNCKEINVLRNSEINNNIRDRFDFCTFSRVMKSKGIEDAVDAIEKINKKYGKTLCTLTIYGEVDKKEYEWFEALKHRISSIDGICYGGVVPFDKSVEALKDYYSLLFPTYYEGEGFAGTLIDAFAAGVPVIATDWHYNSCIVKNLHTGIIYETSKTDKLQESIEYAIGHQEEWIEMKYNCLTLARELAPSNVVKLITQNID